MAYSRNQGEFNEEDVVDRSNREDLDESPSSFSGAETSIAGSGLTERLTDILVEQGDGDLLLQRSDREDMVLQWLQALDMQVMGACRADERLKPLLKFNASSGAEDRLWAHLSQHFDPSEVGVLAMCFCIPLVSIRVGKINKQGTLLCPTAIRGNLNLTLLPNSDMRLSFIGDDGNTERLCTISTQVQCSAVSLDEIRADISGRSFLLKIPDGAIFYFWCSEKSTLLGIELLAKMKDMLRRKPSIAELTGISKSRLDCFASQLRAHLVGSNTRENSECSAASSSSTSPTSSDAILLSAKSVCSRNNGSQAGKANSPYQGSLSPRSSSFKEGLPRSLSSFRNAAREKLRRRGDNYLSAVDNLMVSLPRANGLSSCQSDNEKVQEVNTPLAPSFIGSLGKLNIPPIPNPVSHVSSLSAPIFSPYYCWCPQRVSTFQHPSSSSQMPMSLTESPLLPPLSSLLAAGRSSSLLPPTPPLSLADIPSIDFPALLPDPLVRLPLPSSQQIPTFTPLMCDPIVHIPVIDVCSSGQGYLVSAGPAISSTMPPLHPKLVSPLISEADSVVEKGARETLRLLIGGSGQASPQLINVLPAVLSNTDEKQGVLVAGSRSFYTGATDADAITNGVATLGLASSSGSSKGGGIAMFSSNCKELAALIANINILEDGSCSDDEGSISSNTREGTSD